MTQQFNNNFEREIGWDDTIQKDSERVLLPDGLYWFTVKEYERGRHTPNPQNPGKLPACNKATVHLTIVANEGETELRHNLFLHSSTEGMLSAFFGAIGAKNAKVSPFVWIGTRLSEKSEFVRLVPASTTETSTTK